MQAILEHTSTKFKQYYAEVEVNNDNPMYFIVYLNTEDLIDGEYMMTIYKDDNSIVAEELIRIGDYKDKKTEYKVEKKYIQYVRK